jgi:hypothetical protein
MDQLLITLDKPLEVADYMLVMDLLFRIYFLVVQFYFIIIQAFLRFNDQIIIILFMLSNDLVLFVNPGKVIV